MDDEETPVFRLEKPIELDSLMRNEVTEFSIRDCDLSREVEEDTNLMDVYKYEDIEPHIFVDSDSSSDDEEINDESIDDVDVAFPNLRKKMMNVRDDGKVMKMIVRPGSGGLIPEDDGSNWVVYIHYLAHAEYGELPFDCTYLRGKKPVKHSLSDMFPGMEIAIRSMRKGEKSRFLIHPDLAYGALGAPPRIPPDATLHFQIELFDFCREDKKLVDPNQPLPRETCQDRIAKARRCRENGNKRKKQEKNVNGAIAQYRKGIDLLLRYNMANGEEELEIQNELIKLYANLAVCYLQKGDYRRVCSVYNWALHDCGAKLDRNIKLNYVSAKALRFLGSFAEAKIRLHKASHLRPADDDILNELTELETTVKRTKEEEKIRAKRMMGFDITDQNEKAEDEDIEETLNTVGSGFKEMFRSLVTSFLDDPNVKTLRLPGEHTLVESEYCRAVCKEKKIGFKEVGSAGNSRITLEKRAL